MLLRIPGLALWDLVNDGTAAAFPIEDGGASPGVSVKVNVLPGKTVEAGITCCFTWTPTGTCVVWGWR